MFNFTPIVFYLTQPSGNADSIGDLLNRGRSRDESSHWVTSQGLNFEGNAKDAILRNMETELTCVFDAVGLLHVPRIADFKTSVEAITSRVAELIETEKLHRLTVALGRGLKTLNTISLSRRPIRIPANPEKEFIIFLLIFPRQACYDASYIMEELFQRKSLTSLSPDQKLGLLGTLIILGYFLSTTRYDLLVSTSDVFGWCAFSGSLI